MQMKAKLFTMLCSLLVLVANLNITCLYAHYEPEMPECLK